jgi:hypothetical protein
MRSSGTVDVGTAFLQRTTWLGRNEGILLARMNAFPNDWPRPRGAGLSLPRPMPLTEANVLHWVRSADSCRLAFLNLRPGFHVGFVLPMMAVILGRRSNP